MNYAFVNKQVERHGPVGGLIENVPVIYGGHSDEKGYLTDCISIGQTKRILQTLQERIFCYGLVVNKSYLWLIGGKLKREEKYSTSTEFISLDKPPIKGPNLPFASCDTIMVQVDPNTIYLIGGFQTTDIDAIGWPESNKTWIVNLKNNYKITEGPSLPSLNRTTRGKPLSAVIQLNGRTHIILVSTDHFTNEVRLEILDTTSSSLSWILGKKR